MEELVLDVPGVWADHHVLAVRDALAGVDGIGQIDVSARDATVRVTFDPRLVGGGAISERLAAAGYGPRADLPAAEQARNKPAWLASRSRVTTTDPADLTMSGDHRQY